MSRAVEMTEPESLLAMARRHVRETRQRVERQASIVNRLIAQERWLEAKEARRLLSLLEESLRLAEKHLRMEGGDDFKP
jgi:hypothetical protein